MLYMTVENYYKKISEMKLAEILFYTFPLSFIVGNFALSLHLILFIVSSLFLIKKERTSDIHIDGLSNLEFSISYKQKFMKKHYIYSVI